MKIRPVGTDFFNADKRRERQTDRHDEANGRFSQYRKSFLMRTYGEKDRWTDMTKLMVAFRNIAKAFQRYHILQIFF
jgi:hypothetical protein